MTISTNTFDPDRFPERHLGPEATRLQALLADDDQNASPPNSGDAVGVISDAIADRAPNTTDRLTRQNDGPMSDESPKRRLSDHPKRDLARRDPVTGELIRDPGKQIDRPAVKRPRGRPKGSKSKTGRPKPSPIKGKKWAAMRRRNCQVCAHPEASRMTYLAITGMSRSAIAQKFGVHEQALKRHLDLHVSEEFRAIALKSPLDDYNSLAKVAIESNESILDNLTGIYSVLSNLFIASFSIADIPKVNQLATRMLQTLELKARISAEIMPSQGSIQITQNNLQIVGDITHVISGLARVLQPHPEIRAKVVAFLRAEVPQLAPPDLLEHVPAARVVG
jgi:hypothetical protein